MAVVDTVFYLLAWKVVLPVLFASSVVVSLFWKGREVRQYFSSWSNTLICPHSLYVPDCVKARIFKGRLKAQRSADWNLRNRGLIRILEFGVGEGRNFDIFPNNSRLILLETRPFSRRTLSENLKQATHIKVERILEGKAEDMSAIEDSTVDAVVVTGVLCTVYDIHLALKEILRVLAPGGQLLFAEHCCCLKEGRLERVLQLFLSPLWWLMFDGCHLTRDTLDAVHKASFRQSAHHTLKINSSTNYFLENFLTPVVVGYAEK